MTGHIRKREQGATALLIVIFALLLFTIVTVGFMRAMVQDQQQSNDSELSRGAYDSALAGVEDGKRVLTQCVVNGVQAACDAIDAEKCTTIGDAGIVTPASGSQTDGEVYVKRTAAGDGTDFQQAYTCIKIDRNTNDYVNTLAADTSHVFPLRVSDTESFDTIELSWVAPAKGQATRAVTRPGMLASPPLPTLVGWGSDTPPIMRVQVMQYTDKNVKLRDFDENGGSQTLFIYPSNGGNLTTQFSVDGRRSGTQRPVYAPCSPGAPQPPIDGYYCKVRIQMTKAVSGNATDTDRRAYLRLTSLYAGTDFRVRLYKGANLVNFNGVQPAVDATGRAADVFRRVRARVELIDPAVDTTLYPRATVDITNNLCKTMFVTNTASDYDQGSCAP